MNCRQAEELFSDYRDRALAQPLVRALAEHLDACDECQDLYRTFEEVTGALGALTVPAPRDKLTTRLTTRLTEMLTEMLSSPHEAGAGRLHPDSVPVNARFTAPSPRLLAGASWLAVAATVAMVM